MRWKADCGRGCGARRRGFGGQEKHAHNWFLYSISPSNRLKVNSDKRTWSEVVYEGMEVYRTFVILDMSGVVGESVWVAYRTLSVHDGVRFVLGG